MTIRFDRVQIHNVGVLRDVDLNLAALPGTLVAVTGENGAGKSTLLELLGASIYRQTETRGSLGDLATGRDSSVEVDVVNGHAWKIRHTMDAVSGKGESLVLDHAGAAALPDTKVKFFDAWAKTHLPAPEVLYASTFRAQGSGGFLDLKPGDRKAVVLRALGIERLEVLAKGARDKANDAKERGLTLDARVQDERARSGDVDAARSALALADANAVEAQRLLDASRAELQAWEAERAVLQAAQLEAKKHEDRATSLRTSIATEETTIAGIAERLANNRGVLADEATIRAAAARRAAIPAEIARLEATVEQAAAGVAAAHAAKHAASAHATSAADAERRARAEIDAARRKIAEAEGRLAERGVVIGAVEQAKGAEKVRDRARETVTSAEADLDALRSQRAVGAEGRVVSLRGALERVAENPLVGDVFAGQALAEDDATIALAASLPGRTKAAETALLAAKRALSEAEALVVKVQAVAARLPLVERAETDKVDAGAQLEAASAVEGASIVRTRDAVHALAAAQNAVAAAEAIGAPERAQVATLHAESKALEATAALLPRLEAAAGRVAELEPQVAAGRARVAALSAELATVPTPEALAALRPAPDVASLESAVRCAQDGLALASAAVTRAAEGAARVEALTTERQAERDAFDEWTLLADGFGRDGIQAAEIDAAGPELTAMVNDLLHTCVSTRWTVTLDTQRASADGKKTLEGLDVRVLDTENGREDEATTFSGGERVLIGEAVSLALTMLACRRSGVVGPTIIRDETGAALSVGNGEAYLAMLRRAGEIVGASKVLFVSHVAAHADLADSRIVVGGGTAVVS